MGTPQYMAPEQMTSTRSVDTRADVWALGVCMYQCLTRRLPYETSNMLELGALVLAGAPTPITRHRGDLPGPLVAIVSRCLEKDPAARYPSAVEVGEALATMRARTSLPASAPTLLSGPPPAAATPRTAIAFAGRDVPVSSLPSAPSRNNALMAAVVISLAAALAFVGYRYGASARPLPSSSSAPPTAAPVEEPAPATTASQPTVTAAPPSAATSPASSHAGKPPEKKKLPHPAPTTRPTGRPTANTVPPPQPTGAPDER
jgi:serine/threonine-protein kinase